MGCIGASVEAVLSSEIWGKRRIKSQCVHSKGSGLSCGGDRMGRGVQLYQPASTAYVLISAGQQKGFGPLERRRGRAFHHSNRGCISEDVGPFYPAPQAGSHGWGRGRRRLGMIEAQEWWPVLYWLD
jgi:hypothetical protein